MNQSGSPAPVEGLYVEHQSWLRDWLRRKTGCPFDAADLTHDTYLKVLVREDDVRILREPRAYLTTIAHGKPSGYGGWPYGSLDQRRTLPFTTPPWSPAGRLRRNVKLPTGVAERCSAGRGARQIVEILVYPQINKRPTSETLDVT